MTLAEQIDLLEGLIEIPSFSREENAAADFLEARMTAMGLTPLRKGCNLILSNPDDDHAKPLLMLNAHIDTVKPSDAYSRNPFVPYVENGKLYGLGSNDDGGSLVSLLETWLRLNSRQQPYRLVWTATAEEEVSGEGGLQQLLPDIGNIALAVIGEPTGMKLAVAEKGLMVLDCVAKGRSGHAARDEGENAIYKALPDIEWFRTHCFDRVSEYLGPVKTSVTMISSGTQHNVVPDCCSFVVDVRPNGMYTNAELLQIIRSNVACEVTARSLKHNSSQIAADHPVVKRASETGLELFASPTTSNQTLLDCPSVKIGPGDSARSHTPDEYIRIDEIAQAADIYENLLDGLAI